MTQDTDSLLDQVFSVLPPVQDVTSNKEERTEIHTETHHTEPHEEDHVEEIHDSRDEIAHDVREVSYSVSEFIENTGLLDEDDEQHEHDHRDHHDHHEDYHDIPEDQHDVEIHSEHYEQDVTGANRGSSHSINTGVSEATSVSVHSSVSQKSAQKVPNVLVSVHEEDVILDDHHDLVDLHDNHHDQHHGDQDDSTIVSHETDSTIRESTAGNQQHAASYDLQDQEVSVPSTPVAPVKTAEHDALIRQFQSIHQVETNSMVSSNVSEAGHHFHQDIDHDHHEEESDEETTVKPMKVTQYVFDTRSVQQIKKFPHCIDSDVSEVDHQESRQLHHDNLHTEIYEQHEDIHDNLHEQNAEHHDVLRYQGDNLADEHQNNYEPYSAHHEVEEHHDNSDAHHEEFNSHEIVEQAPLHRENSSDSFGFEHVEFTQEKEHHNQYTSVHHMEEPMVQERVQTFGAPPPLPSNPPPIDRHDTNSESSGEVLIRDLVPNVVGPKVRENLRPMSNAGYQEQHVQQTFVRNSSNYQEKQISTKVYQSMPHIDHRAKYAPMVSPDVIHKESSHVIHAQNGQESLQQVHVQHQEQHEVELSHQHDIDHHVDHHEDHHDHHHHGDHHDDYRQLTAEEEVSFAPGVRNLRSLFNNGNIVAQEFTIHKSAIGLTREQIAKREYEEAHSVVEHENSHAHQQEEEIEHQDKHHESHHHHHHHHHHDSHQHHRGHHHHSQHEHTQILERKVAAPVSHIHKSITPIEHQDVHHHHHQHQHVEKEKSHHHHHHHHQQNESVVLEHHHDHHEHKHDHQHNHSEQFEQSHEHDDDTLHTHEQQEHHHHHDQDVVDEENLKSVAELLGIFGAPARIRKPDFEHPHKRSVSQDSLHRPAVLDEHSMTRSIAKDRGQSVASHHSSMSQLSNTTSATTTTTKTHATNNTRNTSSTLTISPSLNNTTRHSPMASPRSPGNFESVRVVKSVRAFAAVWGKKDFVPPSSPVIVAPRLGAKSPVFSQPPPEPQTRKHVPEVQQHVEEHHEHHDHGHHEHRSTLSSVVSKHNQKRHDSVSTITTVQSKSLARIPDHSSRRESAATSITVRTDKSHGSKHHDDTHFNANEEVIYNDHVESAPSVIRSRSGSEESFVLAPVSTRRAIFEQASSGANRGYSIRRNNQGELKQMVNVLH